MDGERNRGREERSEVGRESFHQTWPCFVVHDLQVDMEEGRLIVVDGLAVVDMWDKQLVGTLQPV